MTVLPPVLVTKSTRIPNTKGDLFHGIKASDIGYSGFGEAYFTTIVFGERKGWKQHTKMVMNLLVPIGLVRFYIHDANRNLTSVYDIGELIYNRLTVPAGYWVAFEGLSPPTNLILNVASLEHDPKETMHRPLDFYPMVTLL